MAMVEFTLRRELRRCIEEASDEQGIVLDQHIIENMINQRIQEIAVDTARGTITNPCWRVRVRDADKILQEARAHKKALGLKYYHDDQEI